MPIVQTFGQVQAYTDSTTGVPVPSRSTYLTGNKHTYAAIYRTQPNVRTCIDYLGRNMAQLGLHIYRRVSDTDRVRLIDHELAHILDAPNPAVCQYKFMETLMLDIGIYWSAYWLKLRGESRLGLVRLPPEQVEVDGWLIPRVFLWQQPHGAPVALAPRDVVYFTGYDPLNPIQGVSPLETLRQILAEERAACAYRESFWNNAARIEGVVERPLAAPKWNAQQKEMFREQWNTRFAGPRNAGGTAVLDEGMTFKTTSYSAQESEYVAARKLTREECAAAYHIPLPMVGILDHATFSNIKEQHKQLYQDTLGPWCRWIEQEIQRQILPECGDVDRVYAEFNIAEKLKGSFEESAASYQTLIGRPIMTPNEGRARLNLPAITDDPTANQLARPLNQAFGGEASVPPTSEGPPLLPVQEGTAV